SDSLWAPAHRARAETRARPRASALRAGRFAAAPNGPVDRRAAPPAHGPGRDRGGARLLRGRPRAEALRTVIYVRYAHELPGGISGPAAVSVARYGCVSEPAVLAQMARAARARARRRRAAAGLGRAAWWLARRVVPGA